MLSLDRDSASHVQLLEKFMTAFPTERWSIIEDNLSIHVSEQTKLALAARAEMEIQFIPKYACWLNLIGPWWKQLRSLALKGRRFETLDQLTQALNDARLLEPALPSILLEKTPTRTGFGPRQFRCSNSVR